MPVYCEGHLGPSYAAQLKRRRPKLGDKWHLDEVIFKINGVQHYPWRAVDQHGVVIDILSRAIETRSPSRHLVLSETVTHHQAEATRDHHQQTAQLWSGEESNSATSLIAKAVTSTIERNESNDSRFGAKSPQRKLHQE